MAYKTLRDMTYDHHEKFKIAGREHYLTRGQLADLVKRDRHRLRQLERRGSIPSPIRVKHGEITVRLYSPEQVAEVVAWFAKNGSDRRSQLWIRNYRAKLAATDEGSKP